MKKFLKVDLRVARKASGLGGQDIAHLLDCSKERISRLENGHARLSVREALLLALIYGLPFEEFFRLSLACLLPALKERLSGLEFGGENQQRLHTLNTLAERLQGSNTRDHVA